LGVVDLKYVLGWGAPPSPRGQSPEGLNWQIYEDSSDVCRLVEEDAEDAQVIMIKAYKYTIRKGI
jgi:hypothetical protein